MIDEAHRLRNVYKSSSKIALAIKQAVAPFPKVLLIATPLQNSLLELYGLVSIIDEFAFGDLKSYRARFVRPNRADDFAELKARLRPICKRTLRRQVLEYVKYTNRHALAQKWAQRKRRMLVIVPANLRKQCQESRNTSSSAQPTPVLLTAAYPHRPHMQRDGLA